MKKVLKNLLGVSAVFAAETLSGCATFFCGTSEEIKIDSMPSGAEVFFNGKFVGYTPIKMEMDRDTHPLVVLSHEDYAATCVQIDWRVNTTVLTNMFSAPLFFLGFPLPGFIMDVRSGAACRYAEDDIVVPLLQNDETKLELYDGDVVLTKFEN